MLSVFNGAQVAHLLSLLCTYYFGYFIYFVLYVCFPCLVFVSGLHSFVFHVWSLSLDYIPLLSTRVLVSLITLSLDLHINCYIYMYFTNEHVMITVLDVYLKTVVAIHVH